VRCSHGLARVCRVVRYYQTADGMRGEVYGDLARLAYYQLGIRQDEGRHHADHVLPSLIGFGFGRGFLGQGWKPLWVEEPYAAAGAAKGLADRIGAEERYGRPGLGMVLDRAQIDVPGRGVSPGFAALRRLVRGATAQDLTGHWSTWSSCASLAATWRRTVPPQGSAFARARCSGACRRRGFPSGRWSIPARRARAEATLATTAVPIAEVAASLGYEEPAHFTCAFQRWHGCSPSEWRRTRRARTASGGTAAVADVWSGP
jgi:hypothetical protein